MEREISPIALVVTLVLVLAVVGWVGWRTLVPRAPMSREEYIRVRNTQRMEIIRRARGLPPAGQ